MGETQPAMDYRNHHHHHQQPNNDRPHANSSLSNSSSSSLNDDDRRYHNFNTTTSPSPISSRNNNNHNHNDTTTTPNNNNDPMQSWWESVSKARTRIQSLLSLLPSSNSPSLSSIADSDRPARSLLDSLDAYSAVFASLSSPLSGSGSDPLCHWLYDTFLSSDPDLRVVVLSFLPLVVRLYLSRVHSSSVLDPSSPSLAGFEAVLLAVYSADAKSRGGKAVTVSIPDLSQPSLYHAPRAGTTGPKLPNNRAVGVLCSPLEPHLAVKSTKRGCIVGVGLDCFYKQISQMPSWSKLELCRFITAWAGEDCPCCHSLDSGISTDGDGVPDSSDEVADGGGYYKNRSAADSLARMGIDEGKNVLEEDKGGMRIPLPWEILQPVLRIIGHCLLAPVNSQEVKDAAGEAVRRLYARASHDLVPQAILATRSLIQIDNRSRVAARAAVIAAASSKASTPTKAKKPEVLLASK